MADKDLEQLHKKLVSMLADCQSSQVAPASTLSVDGITYSISEFTYDPENGVTFESWYRSIVKHIASMFTVVPNLHSHDLCSYPTTPHSTLHQPTIPANPHLTSTTRNAHT
uniref:Uncharacterized protein n=1 Tax=Mesocestoides corti TaxID=53468 RepID=A0A5K3FXT5_MESCO